MRKTKTVLAIVLAIVIGCVFSFASVFAKASPTKQATNAVKWAVDIANNNNYAYGTKPYAQHSGCAFCKVDDKKKGEITTNRMCKEKYLKEWSDKWNRTYCSNTFVFSAYAHGGNVSSMLAKCQKGRNAAIGNELKKYGFKNVKKPKFSKLLPGDILVADKGTELIYIGKTKVGNKTYGKDNYVSAEGGGFGKKSISVKSGAKKRYSKDIKYVMRYSK